MATTENSTPDPMRGYALAVLEAKAPLAAARQALNVVWAAYLKAPTGTLATGEVVEVYQVADGLPSLHASIEEMLEELDIQGDLLTSMLNLAPEEWRDEDGNPGLEFCTADGPPYCTMECQARTNECGAFDEDDARLGGER